MLKYPQISYTIPEEDKYMWALFGFRPKATLASIIKHCGTPDTYSKASAWQFGFTLSTFDGTFTSSSSCHSVIDHELVLHMINCVKSWCLSMGTKFELGLTLQPGMNQTQHFLQLVQLVYRVVQRTSNSTPLKSVVLLQLESSSQVFSIPNSVFSGWYCSRAKIFHTSDIWIHFVSTKFW